MRLRSSGWLPLNVSFSWRDDRLQLVETPAVQDGRQSRQGVLDARSGAGIGLGEHRPTGQPARVTAGGRGLQQDELVAERAVEAHLGRRAHREQDGLADLEDQVRLEIARGDAGDLPDDGRAVPHLCVDRQVEDVGELGVQVVARPGEGAELRHRLQPQAESASAEEHGGNGGDAGRNEATWPP